MLIFSFPVLGLVPALVLWFVPSWRSYWVTIGLTAALYLLIGLPLLLPATCGMPGCDGLMSTFFFIFIAGPITLITMFVVALFKGHSLHLESQPLKLSISDARPQPEDSTSP